MKRPLHKITILYGRVSTDDQAREGASLAAQEERLRAFAMATGRDNTLAVMDEGYSAKNLDRPGLASCLKMVNSKAVSSLISLKLDRLTRSVRDLADLLDIFAKADTGLVSVTESLDTSTASGRLMLNLLASVSQWEREAIGERTSFALAHKRRNGIVYGPTPFGYQRRGHELVREEVQQLVLERIRLMRANGDTFAAIAACLQSEEIKTPRGCIKWQPNSVRQVLHSRMNFTG